jgi:hypothetical protein
MTPLKSEKSDTATFRKTTKKIPKKTQSREQVVAQHIYSTSKYTIRENLEHKVDSTKFTKRPKSSKSCFKKIPSLQEFQYKEEAESDFNTTGNIDSFRIVHPPLIDMSVANSYVFPRPKSSPVFRSDSTAALKLNDVIDTVPITIDNLNIEKYDAVQIAEAQQLWSQRTSILRRCGLQIQYGDITKFSLTFYKKNIMNSIAEYLCILLGINTSFDSIKRNLFRELFPLLKYLREVQYAKYILNTIIYVNICYTM